MPSADDRERKIGDLMKATAYDVRKLAERNVPELRANGLDDLADSIERAVRVAESQAQEWDATWADGEEEPDAS